MMINKSALVLYKYFSLRGNEIGDVGAQGLGEMLKVNNSLKAPLYVTQERGIHR